LTVPDLPTETDVIFGTVFSPDAMDSPGLSLIDGKDYGGLDTEPSSGTGGGIGGGEGTGVGTGEGWGVGPGRGGGFGGGEYRPGGYDIEPTLVFKPPDPPYPPRAREKMVMGEVIVRIWVRLDGTTEVLGILKSLPFCNEAAVEHAKKYRWKPALKNGKPIETEGIIYVRFNLLAPEKRKG
jgi:protein TonB